MDNKNNRQFFWQVKDFMSKTPSSTPKPKQNSLVNTVTNVINSSANTTKPNIHEAKYGIVNSSRNTKQAVSNVLDTVKNSMDKQAPSCKAYTKNIISNPFNLFKR